MYSRNEDIPNEDFYNMTILLLIRKFMLIIPSQDIF